MLSQAGQTTGRELAFPWDPETGRILAETRLGVIWLARLVLAMFAVWLAGGKESPLKDWAGVRCEPHFVIHSDSHEFTPQRKYDRCFPCLAIGSI